MNYEKMLLLKALSGEHPEDAFNKIMSRGITKDFFILNPDSWDFVVKYYKKYGKYPSVDTFKTQLNITDALKLDEPIEFYIDELCRAKRFNILSQGMDKADEAFGKGDIDGAFAWLRRSVEQAATTVASLDVSLRASVDERVADYMFKFNNPGITGIGSGIKVIDKASLGWQGGELILLVAKLGQYKTWTMLHMVKAALFEKKKVLVGTVEMTQKQLLRRLDAILTGVSFDKIRAGNFSAEEFADFQHKLEAVKHYAADCIVIGGVEFGPAFLQTKIDEHKPDVVFIDGVYLMDDDDGKKDIWERLKNVSRDLKVIATDYNIPIIGTTQLDITKVGKRGAGKEGLEAISYSKAMAQNADIVLTWGRIWDAVLEDYTNKVIMKFLKIREGVPVKVHLEYNFENMSIIELGTVHDNRSKQELADDQDVPDLVEGVDFNVNKFQQEFEEVSEDEIPF